MPGHTEEQQKLLRCFEHLMGAPSSLYFYPKSNKICVEILLCSIKTKLVGGIYSTLLIGSLTKKLNSINSFLLNLN